MLVAELIAYLGKLPPETEVCYRDMNYGGVDREFDEYARYDMEDHIRSVLPVTKKR